MMSNAFLRFFFFLSYSNAVFTFQGSGFQLLLIIMIVEALGTLRQTSIFGPKFLKMENHENFEFSREKSNFYRYLNVAISI